MIFREYLITYRFSNYDHQRFAAMPQPKCLSHLLRNLSDLIALKSGKGIWFGALMQDRLRYGLELGHLHRASDWSHSEYLAE